MRDFLSMLKCITGQAKRHFSLSNKCSQRHFQREHVVQDSIYHSCFFKLSNHIEYFQKYWDCVRKNEFNCSDNLSNVWKNDTAKGTLIYDIKIKKTSHKECLNIFYKQSNILNINNIQPDFRMDSIHYTINANFGSNVTFLTFLLSEYCFAYQPYDKNGFIPCYYHQGTEYVIFHQTVTQGKLLYFCMKRPQFSVYINHLTVLKYSLCWKCVNYKSIIVFLYHIIDKNVFATVRDDYTKAYYLSPGLNVSAELVHRISCIIFDNKCVQNVVSIFLVVSKYHYIKLKQVGIGRLLVNVGMKEKYRFLLNSNSFICEHCICGISLIRFLKNASNISSSILLHYFPITSTNHVNFLTLLDMIPIYFTAPIKGKPGQTVYHIKSDKRPSKLVFRSISFDGLKVHACLYGGIAIYEVNKWSSYPLLVNTLTFCDNYISLNDSETSNPVHIFSTEILLMFPYISATDDITIVFYHDHDSALKVDLKIYPSECKGIFINPCMKKIFPMYELYLNLVSFTYYLHYRNNTNRLRTDCLHYQIGSQYVSSEDNILKKNFNLLSGCKPGFCFENCYHPMCLFQENTIDFSQINHLSHYMSNPGQKKFHFLKQDIRGTADTQSLKAVHCSGRKHSIMGINESKEETMSKTWWADSYKWDHTTKIYLLQENKKRHLISIQSFNKLRLEPNELKHPRPQKDKFYKHFSIIIEPFSQSFTTLTLKPPATNVSYIQTKFSPLSGSLCLSDSFRKPSHLDLILELSVLNLTDDKCSIGEIRINTLSCYTYGFWIHKGCFQHSQVYYMEWTSNITTDILRYSANKLIVGVLGRVYNAEIKTDSGSCCSNNSCMLQYRWKYDTNIFYFPHRYYNNKLERDKYLPENITWYEASKVCKRKGGTLPVIFSDSDFEKVLLELIWNWDNYKPVIFIGLHKGVRKQSMYIIKNILYIYCYLIF